MKRQIIIISIIVLTSCSNERMSNQQIILLMKKEILEDKNEYLTTLGHIANLNKYGELYISFFPKEPAGILIRNMENRYENISCSNSTEKYLYKFMIKKQCNIAPNLPDYVDFIFLNILNKEGENIYLTNHLANKVNFAEYYPGYEIVGGDNLPTKDDGWVYVLGNNWIIYSPKAESNKKSYIERNWVTIFIWIPMLFFFIRSWLRVVKRKIS